MLNLIMENIETVAIVCAISSGVLAMAFGALLRLYVELKRKKK